MSDPINTWAADRRHSSTGQAAAPLLPESWGFRWFALYVISLLAFVALDRGNNPAWVDGTLLVAFLLHWVSALMCLVLLVRFLWRSARRVLGQAWASRLV